MRIPVVVIEPWIDPDGNRRLPGQRLLLTREVYARHAGLGYFARTVVRARHFSGREYWHQTVGCRNLPLTMTLPLPTFLEPPVEIQIPLLLQVQRPHKVRTPVKNKVVYHRCGCQNKEQKK